MAEKLILVTGSKGGVGTTTVALNLAVQLAQLTAKRIALLEFARPFGQIGLMLDFHPRFTLLDALGRIDRLDEVLLMRLSESEPVQPTKTAQLVEFDRLTGLRHHDEHSIDFLAWARPPWSAT